MKKLMTALATAGLLAGVFGFAAPKAAQASGVIWVSQKGTPIVDVRTAPSSLSASVDYYDLDGGINMTWYQGYDCNHPDYNDIQMAVDNSQNNDTIYICPGLWKMHESWQSQYSGDYAESAIVTDNPFTGDGTTGLRFVGAGAKKTIIDGLTGGNKLDRAFEVVDAEDWADATFVGLTIQRFESNAVAGDDITCDRSTFSNNGTYESEWSGGAISADGDLDTSGCTFVNNNGDNGGAIYVDGYWTDHGSTFTSNLGDDVGGAAYVGTAVDLHGTVFTRNTADEDEGGALFVAGNDASFIDHVTAIGNKSCSTCNGGAIFFGNTGYDAYVTSSVFKNNTSGVDGGAIYHWATGTIHVTGTLFQGNRAGGNGGAIMAYRITYSGNRFIGNVSSGCGGAVIWGNNIDTPEANTYRGNRDMSGVSTWCEFLP